MRAKLVTLLACFVFLGSLSFCSNKKSKSQLATLSVLPEKPIVFTGKTADSNGNDISPNWFSFRMHLKNETQDTLTIIGLKVTVTAQSVSGQMVSTDVSFSPSDFNYTLDDSTECKYVTFGTWANNDDVGFSLDGASSTSCAATPIFFVGGLTAGPNNNNFRYQVKVEPQGWFGTFDNPTDRYQEEFTFYTE